jgi:hypothetical protein
LPRAAISRRVPYAVDRASHQLLELRRPGLARLKRAHLELFACETEADVDDRCTTVVDVGELSTATATLKAASTATQLPTCDG